MNKNDFRVQFPLWNIALFSILMIFSYGVVYCSDLLFNQLESPFSYENGEVAINFNIPGLYSLIIGAFLLTTFFIFYFLTLNNHNKNNPSRKMNAFTFLKPGEFLEDDELFIQVTRNATRKVYILYSQILPLFVLIMFFPINRYIFIVIIFLTLIIQNALYYREIIKYAVD